MPPLEAVAVEGAADDLRQRLAEARAFAVAQDQPHWDKFLGRASSILEASEHRSELLPLCGYTATAHRLVSAASAAWVFGGMGSWNDMGFSDRAVMREYMEITDALFQAVMDAYLVAVNSFDPPSGL